MCYAYRVYTAMIGTLSYTHAYIHSLSNKPVGFMVQDHSPEHITLGRKTMLQQPLNSGQSSLWQTGRLQPKGLRSFKVKLCQGRVICGCQVAEKARENKQAAIWQVSPLPELALPQALTEKAVFWTCRTSANKDFKQNLDTWDAGFSLVSWIHAATIGFP